VRHERGSGVTAARGVPPPGTHEERKGLRRSPELFHERHEEAKLDSREKMNLTRARKSIRRDGPWVARSPAPSFRSPPETALADK
jgi:hypothetical protein